MLLWQSAPRSRSETDTPWQARIAWWAMFWAIGRDIDAHSRHVAFHSGRVQHALQLRSISRVAKEIAAPRLQLRQFPILLYVIDDAGDLRKHRPARFVQAPGIRIPSKSFQ